MHFGGSGKKPSKAGKNPSEARKKPAEAGKKPAAEKVQLCNPKSCRNGKNTFPQREKAAAHSLHAFYVENTSKTGPAWRVVALFFFPKRLHLKIAVLPQCEVFSGDFAGRRSICALRRAKITKSERVVPRGC